MAASKLVGVRFPPEAYRRLQQHKAALGVREDAEAIRRIVEDYTPFVTPGMIRVFTATPSTPGRRRKGQASALRRADDVVYEAVRPRRRARRRR